MSHISAWREFLGRCITDTQERQRIANELNVSPVTLTRWANGVSNPRPQNLRHLLYALPQQDVQLLELMSEEFPDLIDTLEDDQEKDASLEIPAELYAHVMLAYATTPRVQRFWALSNFILQQALGQLDPNQLGLAVTLVQCMPPSEQGLIRSLRERVGRGTPPWTINLEQQAILLGSESMAGFVVNNCRPLVIQDQSHGTFPAHWVEWEESAAAYPVQRAGAVAGSLVVSSNQPNYFLPSRCKLIEQYSELIALVFEPEEFYPLDIVHLQIMPPCRSQWLQLSSFSNRVSTIMKEAALRNKVMHVNVAEEIAWQQLEEVLLEQFPDL